MVENPIEEVKEVVLNPIEDAINRTEQQYIDGLIVIGMALGALVVAAFLIKFLWSKAFPSEYQQMLQLQRENYRQALKFATPEAVGKAAGAAAGNPAALMP